MTNQQQSSQYGLFTGGSIQGNTGTQLGRGQSSVNTTNNNANNNNAGIPQPGGAMNGQGRAYPDLGLQMDMNVLWEYIQNLSEMHAGIRAQTQQVLNGVQEVQRRNGELHSVDVNGDDGSMQNKPQGESQGMQMANHVTPSGHSQPTQSHIAELNTLRNRLSKSESDLEESRLQTSSLLTLLTDYETTLTHTLTKLRPYAQTHTTALNAQKAHYLALLEEERRVNLDLRIEQQGWQERLADVIALLREAVREQGGGEEKWRSRIKELKVENESLRRVLGFEVDGDSDEDDGPAVTDIAMSTMNPIGMG